MHDFDRTMVNVSIRLAHVLMMDRLIGYVRVFMNKMGYVIITNERHHLVTLELLARMWVIGLESQNIL